MTERITVEHYVGKCFDKCAHIILGSRVYQDEDRKQALDKRSAQWFLLEIEELAGLSALLEPWRRDIYAPLVIEIYIQPWDTNAVMPPGVPAGRQDSCTAAAAGAGGKTLLERWMLSYSAGTSAAAATGSASSRPVVDLAAVYKRLILLIRSLYSYVRVLPAYRMYRACKRHGRELFNTSYSLSTTPLPLTRQQYSSTAAAAVGAGSSGRMQHFVFSPIETMYGVFEMAVEYQPATTVHFLEQTTLLPCQPRIITDYVDGPYAKSAPNDRVLRVPRDSGSSSNAVKEGISQEDGTLNFLRSSQHQAPLIRHSWSSKDIPVVQRGFNPPARSNSLSAAAAAAAGSSANQQQQQQPVSLHRRSLSQGYGAAPTAADQPRMGGGSSAAAAGSAANVITQNVTHAVTHVGSYGNNAGLGNPASPGVFAGPSSLGKPPLPHSPAAAAALAQQHSGSTGYSSMLPGHSSAAAAAAAAALPPASPGTPSSSSRTGGMGSTLLRSLSANAAAAASAAAAAAAAAAAGIASSAPGQAGSGLSAMAVQQLSRLGSSFSSSSSPMGSGPRVLSFGGRQQQQQYQQQQGVMDPQARQQGFHVKDHSSSSSSHMQSGEQQTAQPTQAVAAALTEQQRQDDQPQQQQQQATWDLGDLHTPPAAAAAAVVAGTEDLPHSRSAPVAIPGRGKGRAKSVTDLQLMAEEAAAAAASNPPSEQQQESTQVLGPCITPWQQQQQQQQVGMDIQGHGGYASAALPGLQQQQQHGVSSLLRVQHRQQQVVKVACSAPAAPRGMLGQLLSGSSTTSPSVSPPHDTAAAAAAAPARPTAASAGHHAAAGSSGDSSNERSAVTEGRSQAIIIRPPVPQTAYTAAAAAASPSPSSRLLQLHSRTSSGAAYSLGAQPTTPGHPTSILSCSPQLPFAFTPSAASLGMSIISLTDQHKTLMPGSAGSSGAAVAAARGQAALARSRSAGAAAAATANPNPAAVGSSSDACGSSAGNAAAVTAIGTPSPPPHVSCVRDITGLATIRRPSWSSRSSSFDVAASASLPRHFSVSPMGDLLDPALLGCSCSHSSGHNAIISGHNALSSLRSASGSMGVGRLAAAAAAAGSSNGTAVVMTPAVVVPGGFGPSDQGGTAAAAGAATGSAAAQVQGSGGDPAGSSGEAATAASDAAAAAAASNQGSSAAATAGTSTGDDILLGSVMPDESESDILPFAIDTETYASTTASHAAGHTAMGPAGAPQGLQQQHHQGSRAGSGAGPGFSMTGGYTSAAAALNPRGASPAERDVAVGAFVKLVQEASGRQFQRCCQQQQQGLEGLGSQQGTEHDPAQHQQLLVADAIDQVQQMAAQLQMLMFPNAD